MTTCCRISARPKDNETHDNICHGKGGPLGVSEPRAPLPNCEAYFIAAAELGIPRNMDINGASQDGVCYYRFTQRNARRSSAAMANVTPNRHRQNLTKRLGTQMRRPVAAGGRATGIYQIGGTRVKAGTEVILTTGAVGSPRLLQLSGIGPADQLTGLGIKVVHDQPQTGANLQDHLTCIAPPN